jgi:heat shock protein HtpX
MAMDFYTEINNNKKMTYLLFLMFFLLIGFLSFIISFILDSTMGVGFIFFFSIFGFLSIIFAVISYYSSDKIVTAVSGAKEVSKDEAPTLHNIIEELCLASGLVKPRIFVMKDSAINAFATGRDPEHSVVCFTTGCINRLTRGQLQGVAAHELAHIKNYDIRTMTIATVLVGIAVLLSDFLFRMFLFGSFRNNDSKNGQLMIIAIIVAIVLAILTPVIAKMITFAVSRSREFAADATAVEFTRNPEGLASALEVIKNDSEVLEAANKATAHLYISNPLKGQKIWLKNMFATHPDIDDRITALRGNISK